MPSNGDLEPDGIVRLKDHLVDYLRLSGATPQSIERLEPQLGRWVERLRSRGVTGFPSLPIAVTTSPAEAHAHNEIALLIQQARDPDLRKETKELEHQLRNLNRTRSWKE